ncbi:MAG: glycoside hydrolase family 127 protein [Caldilineaceae bacterium]
MSTQSAQYQLTPVPFTQVTLEDPFWAPRQATNRTITIPHMHQMLVETGRLAAFSLDFEREVPSPIVLIFGDSDPAKWLEAASYALATAPDPTLAKLVDDVANQIISAQQADGYLNTHFTAIQPEMRWKNLRDWHEMYCAGHLMEAAVAHHQATGDPKLLNALSRYADLIDSLFGPEPEKKPGYGGHPEIELALVRLYHATNKRRYLELAKFFVEERGQSDPHYYDVEAIARGDDPKKFWAKNYEYCQAHAPIRQQDKVVGHAVRVMYLMAGVADLAHEYNDLSLLETCERLWQNLVYQRMYLTGGIGPSRHNEGFTTDYDLPDETAYAETCASIALIMWNHRLLQFRGEGKYADIIEQTLYNGFISGLSLDGKGFFYVNPLASAGNHHRTPWFVCPCCPPNVGRILASLGNYFYSTGDHALWVHLYGQNTANVTVNGVAVEVRQVTQYPWDGQIQLTLEPAEARPFTLHLRIPGWCDEYRVTINGAPLRMDLPPQNGYLAITQIWRPGDVVELTLAMPVQSVWAHPAVRQMQGRLALQRGPLVYCLEGVDNDVENLDRIALDPSQISSFTPTYQADLLGGVTVLQGPASLIDEEGWDETLLYRHDQPATTQPTQVTAIPYSVWDNREAGEMRVWFRSQG